MKDIANLESKLESLGQIGADNATPILQDVSSIMQETIDKRFRDQGPGWAKRKGKGTWPLLDKTGRMRNSFGADINQKDLSVVVTNKVKVGRWNLATLHHGGTRHMPARRIFVWGDDLKKSCYDVVMGTLTRLIAGGERAGLEQRRRGPMSTRKSAKAAVTP